MDFLRTARGLLAVTLATILVMGAGIVVSFFTRGTGPAIHPFYTAFGRFTLFGFRSRVRAAGLERLTLGERYVVVANHESHLDVPALLVALKDHPLRFVAKQQLGKIPIFGAALRRSGTVFVTRGDARKDTSRLDAAQAELLEDVSVLFFAEGTRSHDGELQPFKKGAAAFAVKSGLPMVPVAIAGSRAILPRGMRTGPGGTIGLAVGEPIPTAGRSFDERDALTGELRSAIEKELERARELASA